MPLPIFTRGGIAEMEKSLKDKALDIAFNAWRQNKKVFHLTEWGNRKANFKELEKAINCADEDGLKSFISKRELYYDGGYYVIK